MARTISIPGIGDIYEDGTEEYAIPGIGDFNEDQAAAPSAASPTSVLYGPLHGPFAGPI